MTAKPIVINKWKERVIQWLINSIAPTLVIGLFVFFMKTDTGMSVNASELNNIKTSITNLNMEINEVEAMKADKLEVNEHNTAMKGDLQEIKTDIRDLRSLTMQVLMSTRTNNTRLMKIDTAINGTQKKEK